jgi:dihydrofolate reductase
MTKVSADITMSLDGFVAGPEPSLEEPLGKGGMALHEWAFRLKQWREAHGMEGGEEDVHGDGEIVDESLNAAGATIMGRKMFSGGSGPWESDPNANGWWGDDPPFHHPVFVLTSHAREPLAMQGGTTFTFVADGIESALEQARAAAGGKGVHVAGGASAVQQYLNAGLLDEIQIHVAPLLLGSGTRLLDNLDAGAIELRPTRVRSSPYVAHLKYEVAKAGYNPPATPS